MTRTSWYNALIWNPIWTLWSYMWREQRKAPFIRLCMLIYKLIHASLACIQ